MSVLKEALINLSVVVIRAGRNAVRFMRETTLGTQSSLEKATEKEEEQGVKNEQKAAEDDNVEMKNIDLTTELQRLQEENASLKTINEFIQEYDRSTQETNTTPILDLQLHKKTKQLGQEKDDAIYLDVDNYEKQSEKLQSKHYEVNERDWIRLGRLQQQTTLESKIRRRTQEIQHAKEENHNLKKQTQVLQEKNTELTTNIRLLQEENDDICKENRNLKTINQLLQDDNISMQEMNIGPTTDLQPYLHAFNKKQERSQENSHLNNETQQLWHDNIITRHEIQEHREETNKRHSEMQNLHQERDEIIQIQQLREEKNCMVNEMQQLKQENTNKDKEIQQLRQINLNKNNEIPQLQQGMNNIWSEIHVLGLQNNKKNSNDIQQLQLENTKKNNEIQQLEQQNIKKNNEIQQLRQVNFNKNYEIQQLQQEMYNMRNAIHELRLENDNMNREMQKVREENNNMRCDMQELQQENNHLKMEIQQIQGNTMHSLITESGSVVVSNEELGRGAWGAVYTGNFYGTKVAVKEFHEIILSPHNMEILEREIYITSQCRHPNLLQFICATKNDQDRLLIVTELMDMALRTLLEQHARERLQLEYQKVKSISLDVARGLNYLHSKTPNPIIHRDVSSANVLLWVGNGAVRRAKISDYGSANFMQACNTANPGAALYAAPEASRGQQGPKIDVFSYGLLVCEMSICQLPHPEQVKRKGQMRRILNAGIKRLVESCTEIDPRKRPTMQDVIGFWQNMK